VRRISKRKRNLRKSKRELLKTLSRIFVITSILIMFITIFNIPILTIPLNHEHSKIKYEIKYDLVVTLTWFRYLEEAKYIQSNVSAVSIDVMVNNKTKTIAIIPFKPGKIFTLGYSISYTITTHELPVKLFVRENLSKVRFPLAVISSYRKVFLPLSTYYFEAMFEAYMVAREVLMNVSSSKPLLIKLVLHKLATNATKILGPFVGDNISVRVNETFLYMDIGPYLVIYGLLFRVSDNSALLYPLDNLVLFIPIIVILLTASIIIKIISVKRL